MRRAMMLGAFLGLMPTIATAQTVAKTINWDQSLIPKEAGIAPYTLAEVNGKLIYLLKWGTPLGAPILVKQLCVAKTPTTVSCSAPIPATVTSPVVLTSIDTGGQSDSVTTILVTPTAPVIISVTVTVTVTP